MGNNAVVGTLLRGDEVSVAESTEDDTGGGVVSDGKANASVLQSSKFDDTAVQQLESVVSSISSLNLGATMASAMNDQTTNSLAVEAAKGHDIGHAETEFQDKTPSDSAGSSVEAVVVDTLGINPENPDNEFHCFPKLPAE